MEDIKLNKDIYLNVKDLILGEFHPRLNKRIKLTLKTPIEIFITNAIKVPERGHTLWFVMYCSLGYKKYHGKYK